MSDHDSDDEEQERIADGNESGDGTVTNERNKKSFRRRIEELEESKWLRSVLDDI